MGYILKGKRIRAYGEMPEKMGGFERLAPSEYSNKILKMISLYKNSSGKSGCTIDLWVY